jgi:ribosomal protein S18 acetylase RimI-like enzyme
MRKAVQRLRIGRSGTKRPQLEMRWPTERKILLSAQPLSDAYALRQYRARDRGEFDRLMTVAEMGPCPLEIWLSRVLPNGLFVIEHLPSAELVGTCMASHAPALRYPFGGNLGWLAVDPRHRGQRLARALTVAVVSRLIRADYENIYLTTDDWRLPAISLYLNLGWVPVLFEEEMTMRWEGICLALNRPFRPETWSESQAPNR